MTVILASPTSPVLDFTWYFYPDALPETAVAQEKIRNGHIDRKLSFPLEDLYGDGQPAGQVGQEIYGCGGAFIFAARAYDRCGNAPFLLFCDYATTVTLEDEGVRVQLHGAAGQTGRLRVLKKPRIAMPTVSVRLLSPDSIVPARDRGDDFRDYQVPADATVMITTR